MAILSRYFTPSDLTEIKNAVKEAEKKTSGEIVPYFAEASHHYKEWCWFGAFTGGGILGIILLCLDMFQFQSWGYSAIDGVVVVWLGAIMGFLLTYFSARFRLYIVPRGTKRFFVELKAKEAFLDEEVFRTGNRTGILIYISLYEKMVRVLPDNGISHIVPKSEWDESVRLIVEGMKSGNRKEGIVASVLFCGNLLVKYGLNIQKDDRNEISDEIRDGGTQL